MTEFELGEAKGSYIVALSTIFSPRDRSDFILGYLTSFLASNGAYGAEPASAEFIRGLGTELSK